MFSTSSQAKYWLYRDEQDVASSRQAVNAKYVKSQKRSGPEAEVQYLTSSEERILLLHYEFQLKEFCRKFVPPMPRYVVGTAIHYLKRFYLNNSVMAYQPKEILVTCVYLSCKVEEFNVSMDQFVGNLKGDREKAASIILNNELLLMQQLNYHLTIHNPFRPLEGLIIDIKTRFRTFQEPERLRPGVDDFLEKVFYTDAILIYSPSQISLAAIIHSASCLKENVDEYITRTLFVRDDEKFLFNLVEAVKKIRVMVKLLEFPSRETIKVLEKKLETCMSQESNAENSSADQSVFDLDENDEWHFHDIAFAPNLGRSYHILGVASKDVRIIILRPPQKDAFTPCSTSQLEIFQAAQFDDHNSTVWRISWNITGTILASSGDDGCLRMWKANYLHNWKCVGVLKGDGTGTNGEEGERDKTSATARYYKLGTISNPTQVPWH
nr:EOG090X080D [Leptodora kindtii]